MGEITIDYATQPRVQHYRSLIPYAVACGAAPLGVGFAVFILWGLTRSAFFYSAGLWTIIGGLIPFSAGCMLVVIHTVMNWPLLKSDRNRSVYRKRIGWTVLLLFSNFPACAILVFLVVAIEGIAV